MQKVQQFLIMCFFTGGVLLLGTFDIYACLPKGILINGLEAAQLKKDNCHQYNLEVSANSYWEITVEQKGVDVELKLLENEKELKFIDSENFNTGFESLAFVAEQTAKYVLQIKWLDDKKTYFSNDGIYKIKIETRQATAEDKKFVESLDKAGEAYNNATSKKSSRSQSVEIDYYSAVEIYKSRPENKVFKYKLCLTNYYLGSYLNTIQKYRESLVVLEENLSLALEIQDKFLEAVTLKEIGVVSLKLGDNQKSFDYLSRAFLRYEELLSMQVGMKRNAAVFYLSFADTADRIGHKEKALTLLENVRLKYPEITDIYVMASVKMADILLELEGQKKAEEILSQLTIPENLRPAVKGHFYKVSAKLFFKTDKEKALQLLNKAFEFFSQNEREQNDVKLFIGITYFYAKDYQIAKKYFEETQVVFERSNDKYNLANVLNNLGVIYYLEDSPGKAVAVAETALVLNTELQNDINKTKNLINLMYFYNKLNNDEYAIFYGKWAINTVQFIKYEALQNLEKELQQNFKASFNDAFRELASILIKVGRISEAEQVMRFIKEKEYFDYVRGNSKLKGIDYTEKEEKILKEILTKDEKTSLKSASDLFNKEIFSTAFSNSKVLLKNFEQQQIDVSKMLFVSVLVSRNSLSLIVTSNYGQKVYTSEISRENLSKLVFEFRSSLTNLKKDPRITGKKLYDLLVKPFEKDLAQSGANKIIWSLDGVLRYVSIPALYDGRRYLVEKLASVQITFASEEKIILPRNLKLSAIGLASSKPFENLPSLPDAKNELDCIFEDERKLIINSSCKKGLIKGKKFADEEFTQELFEEALGKYQLIHLTSHFVLQTGDSSQSYLLLGGGKNRKYTMQSFSSQRLNNTEMLIMSACDTANLSLFGDGAEFESFASLAQKQGAKSVLGTLWSVSDNSTSKFMYSFYKLYQINRLDKSEALQKAQALMASDKNYNHPFYWAPFVIFGNWQ